MFTSDGVAAQVPPPGPPGPPLDIDRIAVLLDLDSYQKTAVKQLLDRQRVELEARRREQAASGERPSRETLRAEREQADKALLESLQQILTEQQIEKFKLLHNRPASGPPARGSRPDGGSGR